MLKNRTWSEYIFASLVLVLLGLGVGIVVLSTSRMRSDPPGSMGPNCSSNLKQIGLAMLQYTQDYDTLMPPVNSGGASFGWADALLPYLKNSALYQCQQQEKDTTGVPVYAKGYTDYWCNARLSGRKTTTFGMLTYRVLAGDGNDGTDLTTARYSLSGLPTRWIIDPLSPLYRHKEKANYLFVDGHVKALRPADIKGTPGFTF